MIAVFRVQYVWLLCAGDSLCFRCLGVDYVWFLCLGCNVCVYWVSVELCVAHVFSVVIYAFMWLCWNLYVSVLMVDYVCFICVAWNMRVL